MKNKSKEIKTEQKKKRKIHKLTIFLGIADILILLFFFIAYGPFANFRNWWITTALATGNHKYYANVIYSENTITKVMKNNTVIESGDDTDTSKIVFDNSQKDTYSSIYEEQVLKRNPGDLYKLVEIKEKDYSGFMIVVYDSKKVDLFSPGGGKFLDDLSRQAGAIAAINASGFSRNMVPTGTVIENGRVKSVGKPARHGGGLIGFNKDGVLVLTTNSAETAIRNGMMDAVTFGPFLIVNGKSAKVSGNGGWGVANRTAIAQRQDGIVLLLVIDGRGANGSNGISIKGLITLFERYGAYNAANLDGGGSTTMALNHEIINSPRGYGYAGKRYIPNAWILK